MARPIQTPRASLRQAAHLKLPRRVLLLAAAVLCIPPDAARAAGEPARAAQTPSEPSVSAPRVLRVGIGLGPSSIQAQSVRYFGEQLLQLSGGAYSIELHPGGELGNDLTMTTSLQKGTLDMTVPDSSTLSGFVKGFSAINYPFTFLSEYEADTILDGPWGQRLLDELRGHGLVGLAFWENGFRQLTNNVRPLQQPADFAGIRMRTMQNPLLVDSFRRLGFEPVPLPFPQVYEALRTGAVEGQENPLTTILSSRFYEVQKYLTISRHVYSAHVLLLSRTVWDGMRPAHRTAFMDAAAKARAFERRLSRTAGEQALAELKARGMQVSVMPRAESERIRVKLRDVFDQYNHDIGVRPMLELYTELSKLRTASP